MIAQTWSLGSYVERYILQRDIGSVYAEQLRARVRLFEAWAGGQIFLIDLNDELLNGFLLSLKGKVKPRTIKGYRQNILSVWNGAVEDDAVRLHRPGRIRSISVPDNIVQAWTIDELRALLAASRNLVESFPWRERPILLSHWFEAYLRTGYETALRRGDLFRLTASMIGPDGMIDVVQSKTGHAHRVQLTGPTMEAIQAIGSDGKPVFPWPWRVEAFYVRFRGLVKAAKIRPGTSKWLRRSGASYAELVRPGAGRMLLGHRSDRIFAESRPWCSMSPRSSSRRMGI